MRNFRVFLEYLTEETQAGQIYIIGYSAGTWLVLKAMPQLALMNHHEIRDMLKKKLRIEISFWLEAMLILRRTRVD